MILKHGKVNKLTQHKKNAVKIMFRYHFLYNRLEVGMMRVWENR